MSKRLPSLTALRTFEAAARNLSFVKAGRELSVTPAAVGYQIKQLEAELGVPLFVRHARSVSLTDLGRQLAGDLGPSFRTIESAWAGAQEPAPRRMLRITGPAKAVNAWILVALADAPPPPGGARIAWDLSREVRDVAAGEVDMAVRWARAPESQLHWEPMLRTFFTPLMRPDVARFVERPADLAAQGLINVEFVLDMGTDQTAWASWHRLQGLDLPGTFAMSCSDTVSAIDAAIATGHVAIGGSFLASGPLERGALVAPFDLAVVPFSRFWLVCRPGFEETDVFRWFRDALRTGAEAIGAKYRGMRMVHVDGRAVED